MKEVADESVQVIITSPPYWQQRIYDVPDIEFPDGWRGQFGMERSPQLYIAHSMVFLKEMWRVLNKNGVLLYNLADKYISAKGTCRNPGGTAGRTLPSVVAKKEAGVYPLDRGNITEMRSYGLKPKDMALVPERFALAAQEAGWTIRQQIIWRKENVAPESVNDRPKTEHEIIWMLTKRARYYWNRQGYMVPTSRPGEVSNIVGKKYRQENLVPPGDPQDRGKHSQYVGLRKFRTPEKRPVRSVWSFATEGYAGKHRSVFPEKLVEICVRLASREGDLVLDPFLGTGTTLKVAKRLSRRAIGYELSPKYLEMARERTAQLTTEEV
jgi:DNA modification methylase